MPRNRKRWEILATQVVQSDNLTAIRGATAALRIVAVKQDGQLRTYKRNVKAGGASMPVTAIVVRRPQRYCAGCGEYWPCSDSQRTDISPLLRASHYVNGDPLPHVTHTVDASIPRHVWPTITEQ